MQHLTGISFIAFANTTITDRAIFSKLFKKRKPVLYVYDKEDKIREREKIKTVDYPTQNSNKIKAP